MFLIFALLRHLTVSRVMAAAARVNQQINKSPNQQIDQLGFAQLTTTVIGAGPSASSAVLIRNRWPSALTS